MRDPRIPSAAPNGERYAQMKIRHTILVNPLVLAKAWPAAGKQHILVSSDNALQIVPSWTAASYGQKVQLDRGFKWCSEKFKQEFNGWLLHAFGEGECYHVIRHAKGRKLEYSAGTLTLKQTIAQQRPFICQP